MPLISRRTMGGEAAFAAIRPASVSIASNGAVCSGSQEILQHVRRPSACFDANVLGKIPPAFVEAHTAPCQSPVIET